MLRSVVTVETGLVQIGGVFCVWGKQGEVWWKFGERQRKQTKETTSIAYRMPSQVKSSPFVAKWLKISSLCLAGALPAAKSASVNAPHSALWASLFHFPSLCADIFGEWMAIGRVIKGVEYAVGEAGRFGSDRNGSCREERQPSVAGYQFSDSVSPGLFWYR